MEREKMLDAIYTGLLKEAREAMEREQLEEHYAQAMIEGHKLSTDAELVETLENMKQAGLIEEDDHEDYDPSELHDALDHVGEEN